MTRALLLLLTAASLHAQTILAPDWLKDDAATLAKDHPSLKFSFYVDGGDALTKAAEAEGYIGSPDAALLEAAPKLKWVHIFSAGIERYTGLPGIRDGRVTLTNLKIHQGPEIADHAMAMLLSLTRNLPAYQRAQQDGKWVKSPEGSLPMIELRGRTMLVVGYGGIGTQVAERARAFGMKVMAVDIRDIPLTQTLDRTGKPDELDEMLPLADVVVSCVPLTPQTEKMFGAAQFTAMKGGAYFINVSRGQVVDTAALEDALRRKKLGGAGLDVTDPEPLPADHALWQMPQVIITPHVAGISDARSERQAELIRENLARFAKGLPLKNRVDPEKGY
jgi:phosphoglycerate dehydrogenase-like enzyme